MFDSLHLSINHAIEVRSISQDEGTRHYPPCNTSLEEFLVCSIP